MIKIMGTPQASVEQMKVYIKKSKSTGVRFGHKDDSSVYHGRHGRGRAW